MLGITEIERSRRQAICRRIAHARAAAYLTEDELAGRLSAGSGRVSARDVRRFETSRVPWLLLDDIASLTGTSRGQLLYGGEEPEQEPDPRWPTGPGPGAAEGRDPTAAAGPRPPRSRALVGLAAGFAVAVAVQATTGSTPLAVLLLAGLVLLAVLRGPRSSR